MHVVLSRRATCNRVRRHRHAPSNSDFVCDFARWNISVRNLISSFEHRAAFSSERGGPAPAQTAISNATGSEQARATVLSAEGGWSTPEHIWSATGCSEQARAAILSANGGAEAGPSSQLERKSQHLSKGVACKNRVHTASYGHKTTEVLH